MPAEGAEWQGVEDTSLGHRACARASARARLLRHGGALGEPRRQPARARRGDVPRAGAVAARRAHRHRRRRRDRQRHARHGRRDRRPGRRAGDGAHAALARPARLVRGDRAQRRPEPRLGDLRADRHRDGGGGPVRPGLRLRGQMAVDDPVRAAHGGDGARRADRRRAPLRPPLRALGRARIARLPHVVDDRQRRPRRLLVAARRRRVGVVRHRSHDRPARFLAASHRRLHALLARQAVGVRRLRDWLSRPERVALRSRRRARARRTPRSAIPTRPS